MSLDALAAAFLAEHAHLTLGVIGTDDNLGDIDARPFGVEAEQWSVAKHPELAQLYLRTNQHAFGVLGLPRWVLSDLYLLPSVIGVFFCEARHVRDELRAHLGAAESDRVIGAAYVGAPTVHPGRFAGVSLLSYLKRPHAAAWMKAFTLRMLRARQVRGVAQWDNKSLRVHTRLGPMRLVGRAPGGHELADRTFVYETDFSDDAKLEQAMTRTAQPSPTHQIAANDTEALKNQIDEAIAGARLEIVAPGLEQGQVQLRRG